MYNSNMQKLNEVIIEKLTTITSKKNDALLPCFFIAQIPLSIAMTNN